MGAGMGKRSKGRTNGRLSRCGLRGAIRSLLAVIVAIGMVTQAIPALAFARPWDMSPQGMQEEGCVSAPAAVPAATPDVVLATLDGEQGAGNITVAQGVVSDVEADRLRPYLFTVTMLTAAPDAPGATTCEDVNGTYGDMVFERGIATFSLLGGQAATATGLPAGLGYMVEQAGVCGMEAAWSGEARGQVAKDATVEVGVTSTRLDVKVTAELKVTRAVDAGESGGGESGDDGSGDAGSAQAGDEVYVFELAQYAADGEDLVTRGDVMPGVIESYDGVAEAPRAVVHRLSDPAEDAAQHQAPTYEVASFGQIGYTKLGTYYYTIAEVASGEGDGDGTTYVGEPMFAKVVVESWEQGAQVFYGESFEDARDAVSAQEVAAFAARGAAGGHDAGEDGDDPGPGEDGDDPDDPDPGTDDNTDPDHQPLGRLRMTKTVLTPEEQLSAEELALVAFEVRGEHIDETLTLADFTPVASGIIGEDAGDEGGGDEAKVLSAGAGLAAEAQTFDVEGPNGYLATTYVWESDWLPVTGDADKDAYTVREENSLYQWGDAPAYSVNGSDPAQSAEGVKLALADQQVTDLSFSTTLIPPALVVSKALTDAPAAAKAAGTADATAAGTEFAFVVELSLDQAAGGGSAAAKSDAWKNTTYRGTRNAGTAETASPVTFRNGRAVVKLKAGQSQSVECLPIGVRYVVTEAPADGFALADVSGSGVADKDRSCISDTITAKRVKKHVAAFVNARAAQAGTLTVRKVVRSVRAEDKSRSFVFRVTLDDNTVSGRRGDMLFRNGVAIFSLRDGDSKSADGLPLGDNGVPACTVEETNAGGLTPSAQTTQDRATGSVTITVTNTYAPATTGGRTTANTSSPGAAGTASTGGIVSTTSTRAKATPAARAARAATPATADPVSAASAPALVLAGLTALIVARPLRKRLGPTTPPAGI